jgi:hypothetical protein
MNSYQLHQKNKRLFNALQHQCSKFLALIVIAALYFCLDAISESNQLFIQGCIWLDTIIFALLVYRFCSEFFFKRYSHCKVIPVGKKITFSRFTHVSVGFWSDISYDETYFSLYVPSSHSPKDDDYSCGGDSDTRTYDLTALKRGKTKIVINDFYRGSREMREKISILII